MIMNENTDAALNEPSVPRRTHSSKQAGQNTKAALAAGQAAAGALVRAVGNWSLSESWCLRQNKDTGVGSPDLGSKPNLSH